MKIGLWAFFGLGNLGDSAIQTAVVQSIHTRDPNADICFVCLDPKAVWEQFGLPACSIYAGHDWYPLQADGKEMPVHESASDSVVDSESEKAPRLNGDSEQETLITKLKRMPVLRQIALLLWKAKIELRHQRLMWSIVRSMDCLVISGSGVLDDTWQGGWRRPLVLFRWCATARLAGTPLEFHSIGATSLFTSLGKFFGARSLSLASFRSFRDQQSLDFARKYSFGRSDSVTPDLAYSLTVGEFASAAQSNQRAVAIGPIPYYDPRVWPSKNRAVYDLYLEKLCDISCYLIGKGFRIAPILGHSHVDMMAARDLVEAIDAREGTQPGEITVKPMSTVNELMQTAAKVDLVITSRFHGVLLSYLLEKPVVGISYNRKICNLMSGYEQGQHCYDISDFAVESAVSSCNVLIKDAAAIKRRIRSINSERSSQVSNQYDLFFSRLSG